MTRPALHIVGLPHTQTTAAYSTCAYTQKVRKLAKMMTAAGRRVVVYSGRDNDAPCAEHVQLVSEKERRGWFGKHDAAKIYAVDWNPDVEYWRVMNHRAVAEITRRAEPHDLVCLTMGHSQHVIRDAMDSATGGCLTCEPGVGYVGVITHAAFESYAWMHHVYGILGTRRNEEGGNIGGKAFDTVIPNYFDVDEFPEQPAPTGDPYLLFMGRVMLRKGPQIAARIAAELGLRLVVAGPGALSVRPGEIIGTDNVVLEGDVDYVGALGFEARVRAMAGAAAILTPTLYLEPFGGVAVEAMLCGTPAVASDWGAFIETVKPGVSGYRFSTLKEGIEATRAAMLLDRAAVRQYAVDGYSLDAVAPRFDRWFDRLDQLWRSGWDEL